MVVPRCGVLARTPRSLVTSWGWSCWAGWRTWPRHTNIRSVFDSSDAVDRLNEWGWNDTWYSDARHEGFTSEKIHKTFFLCKAVTTCLTWIFTGQKLKWNLQKGGILKMYISFPPSWKRVNRSKSFTPHIKNPWIRILNPNVSWNLHP